MARTASRPSATETGSPARRSSATNPVWRSMREAMSASSRLLLARGPSAPQSQFLGGALLVGDVLEDDAEGAGDGGLVQVVQAEGEQGARPVDGLGDRRGLLDVQVAQRPDGADELLGQFRLDAGDLGEDDVALPLGRRVVEVQVEAAPLERLRQLPGGV